MEATVHALLRVRTRAGPCVASRALPERTIVPMQCSRKNEYMRYTESEFATCRKQTRMSEKAKNTSEFVN
jgi:hypothetical protein